MDRNIIGGVIATATAGWLGLTYAREAITLAPMLTEPVVPAGAAQPKPIDIVEGQDGWLFPGWDYLVDERPDQTGAAIEQIVKMVEKARAWIACDFVANSEQGESSP